MANDDFSEPPRRADSKNPIFFFSRFLGLGPLQGLGVRLGRILGVLSIEPFLGGGVRPEGLSTPPPPRKRKPGFPCGEWCSGAAATQWYCVCQEKLFLKCDFTNSGHLRTGGGLLRLDGTNFTNTGTFQLEAARTGRAGVRCVDNACHFASRGEVQITGALCIDDTRNSVCEAALDGAFDLNSVVVHNGIMLAFKAKAGDRTPAKIGSVQLLGNSSRYASAVESAMQGVFLGDRIHTHPHPHRHPQPPTAASTLRSTSTSALTPTHTHVHPPHPHP